MTTTTTVTPTPASGPGALAGFDIHCSDCGFVGGYSLRTLADQQARGHLAYSHPTIGGK